MNSFSIQPFYSPVPMFPYKLRTYYPQPYYIFSAIAFIGEAINVFFSIYMIREFIDSGLELSPYTLPFFAANAIFSVWRGIFIIVFLILILCESKSGITCFKTFGLTNLVLGDIFNIAVGIVVSVTTIENLKWGYNDLDFIIILYLSCFFMLHTVAFWVSFGLLIRAIKNLISQYDWIVNLPY